MPKPSLIRSDRNCGATPKPTYDRKYFGLPAPTEFVQQGVLGLVLNRFLAGEKAIDEYCREMAHAGVAARYQHAMDLRNSPEAFEAWKSEPLVLGLDRQPKNEEDICRALFRVTYLNPSTASKRWKRIETFWRQRAPVSKVIAHLNMRGLQPPSRMEPQSDGGKKGLKKDLHETENREGGVDSNKVALLDTADVPNAVRLSNLPTELSARKFVGDFVVVGGYISSKDGDCVVLQGVVGG